MSEKQSEHDEGTLSDAKSEKALSGTERIFVRLAFWQTILAVVGVFIAVLALYAALTESAAVRRQTSAAVWPFIQVSVADYDSGQDAGFTLSFTNTGVGPALVRSVRLVVDGKPMRSWPHVVDHLQEELDGHVGRNAISNRVLSPGQKVDLVSVSAPKLARKFQALVRNPESAITYCYCSIFNECWLADSRSQALDPKPINACPDYGDDAFQN